MTKRLSQYAIVTEQGQIRWATEDECKALATGDKMGNPYVYRRRRGLCQHKKGKRIRSNPRMNRHALREQGLLAMERKGQATAQ